MGRAEIMAMKPEEIDRAIAELMEKVEPNTKTYAELEKEDGGSYGCWEVESPGGWWVIRIDWGEDRKTPDKIPQWTHAKYPCEEDDIEAAFEVIDHVRIIKIGIDITTAETEYFVSADRLDKDHYGEGIVGIIGCSFCALPATICIVALLAVEVEHE